MICLRCREGGVAITAAKLKETKVARDLCLEIAQYEHSQCEDSGSCTCQHGLTDTHS
jgi:hypothetical protein